MESIGYKEIWQTVKTGAVVRVQGKKVCSKMKNERYFSSRIHDNEVEAHKVYEKIKKEIEEFFETEEINGSVEGVKFLQLEIKERKQ